MVGEWSLWRNHVLGWNYGNVLVGNFRVPKGVKITSEMYVGFMIDHFAPWYKK